MSDEKITARVLRINSDCDVAVLTVDDPDFWMMSDPDSEDSSVKIELPAFEFGELPELQDTVRVVGYELPAYFLASSLCLPNISKSIIGFWSLANAIIFLFVLFNVCSTDTRCSARKSALPKVSSAVSSCNATRTATSTF
jgi:hypothetical protein